MRFLSSTYLALALALGFASSTARAFYCADPAPIEDKAELCDDNEMFAQAAETCRNDYLKAVADEQARLAKDLGQSLAATKDAGVQKSSEGVTAATYDTALARLDALIARGNASAAEEIAYISSFLPPFVWPTEDLGAEPARNDPLRWQAYDGEFCFGEHRETIDHMVKDIRKAVADLQAARVAAAKLKSASLANGSGFNGSSAGPNAKNVHAAGPRAVGAGVDKASKSDVTGVQQDEK